MPPEGLVGPAVVAALVSGAVSFIAAMVGRATSVRLQTEKLEADRQLAERKFEFDKDLAERKFQAEQDRADWARRNETYQSIIERLPSLVTGRLDPDKMDELLTETRRLWLIASPNVVRVVNDFISAVETGQTTHGSLEEHLGVMITALREDVNLTEKNNAFLLNQTDFRIKSASRVPNP